MESFTFASRSLEETESFLSRAYAPVRLAGLPQGAGLRMARASAGGLTVDRLDVDYTLTYDAEALGRICLVTVHRGSVVDTTGGLHDVFGPGETFLIAPWDRPFTGEMRSARSTLVLFDPRVLDQIAAAGTQHRGPVRFTGRRPTGAGAYRRLGATIGFLRDAVLTDPAADGRMVETATEHLAAVVLACLPNTTMSEPHATAGSRDADTETLRRAMTFIEDNAHRDIGLADIVAAACVTSRAVQYAFSRHADTTPLGYLRRVRLDRVHSELVDARAQEATVTAIASRWGFGHQGRFAATYRAAYGTSPSATLRTHHS
ncbi:AraC family transcriptional regulator [Streptomyces zhihengii]